MPPAEILPSIEILAPAAHHLWAIRTEATRATVGIITIGSITAIVAAAGIGLGVLLGLGLWIVLWVRLRPTGALSTPVQAG